MVTLQGVGASIGVGDGLLHYSINPLKTPVEQKIQDADTQCEMLVNAIKKVVCDMQLRLEALLTVITLENAHEQKVLKAQCDMLEDEEFVELAKELVNVNNVCAQYAVYSAAKKYKSKKISIDKNDAINASMKVVEQIAQTHLEDLCNNTSERIILAIEELTPSLALHLNKEKLSAIILRDGALNSYSAIFARSLGIPTVTGVNEDFGLLKEGVRTMVDGEDGIVVQQPDTMVMSKLAQKRLQTVRNDRQIQMLQGVPAQTISGVTVQLSANIFLPQDAKRALSFDAEGIGLFRSEILYLKDEKFPTEDELYQAYREVLLMMGGKRVVVRLLDFGSNRETFCQREEPEFVSYLSVHSTSYALHAPELFEPQLRALLRASAYGNLAILLPMVVDASEVAAIKNRIGELRHELRREHKLVSDHVAVGALIETPSAAATADLIAEEADFLSIGTNDLTQYMLTCDRTSLKNSKELNSKHPAVLRTVAQVVRMAHSAGVPVSICGEIACDESLAGFFSGLRVTELSMMPAQIPKMKRAIRALHDVNCKEALKNYLKVTRAPYIKLPYDKKDNGEHKEKD